MLSFTKKRMNWYFCRAIIYIISNVWLKNSKAITIKNSQSGVFITFLLEFLSPLNLVLGTKHVKIVLLSQAFAI